jgi:hypothetical protein
MLKKHFYLLSLLFVPVFSVLAVTDEKQSVWGKVVIPYTAFIEPFYTVFKLFLPYLLVIILVRIAFAFFGKKVKILVKRKRTK